MGDTEAGSGRDHSGGRGGGQESAASSLRNRRGEHGVPCASYVKRATGPAANGCAAHASQPPWYANKDSSRPMGGALGGRSARGHVFHYVTAVSRRRRRRRRRAALRLHAAHNALLSAAATAGVSSTDGRADGPADKLGTRLRGKCAAGRTSARLGRRPPCGRRLAGYVTAPARPGAGGSGCPAGGLRAAAAIPPAREARSQNFLGHLIASGLETGLGCVVGTVIPILQIRKQVQRGYATCLRSRSGCDHTGLSSG